MARDVISRDNPAKYDAASAASLGMWRYRDLFPLVEPVTLGEGWTPLLRSRRYPGLFIKDEGQNPTGNMQARGLSLAVAMARHGGLRHVASVGEDSAALAAYAAAAGLTAHVYLPREVDFTQHLETAAHGADIHLIEGTIADCHAALAEQMNVAPDLWRDLSDPLEASRFAGAKTLGYELCEQLGWQYPGAVICPAEAIPALSEAFEELEKLGWIAQSSERPCMYPSAQIAMAAPNAEGLMHAHEGLLLSPEGTAGFTVYQCLLDTGALTPGQRVVLINPSSGLRYLDILAKALHLRRPVKLPWSMPVGGIITPV